MWKFTCFNGTEYISNMNHLPDAIEDFEKKTNLHILNIKRIDNLT